MRALKALVIGMAVLIFAGVVVLIVGIVDKAGELDGQAGKPAHQAVVPAATFRDTEVDLPAGATIVDTRLEGNRILLRATLPDGTSRIILISATTGKRIGTIRLK